MSSLNKAIIIGHLGRDPEVRYTQNSQPVCNFSVATDERWTDKDGAKQERTEWHRIVVWGKQAESCGQYLKKGRAVCVEGRIQTREWEKDGEKKYTTEIVASQVIFLGGKSESASKDEGGWVGGEPAPQKKSLPPGEVENPDIPF